ncbi:MAG: hypothetical protein ACXQS8_09410 [Candidatus Helarchaeales archaeon]
MNNIIEHAIKAEKMGTTLYKILDEFQYYLFAIEINNVLVPVNIFIFCLDKALKENHENTLSKFREFGKWYANFTRFKFNNLDEVFLFLSNSFDVLFSKYIRTEITPVKPISVKELKHVIRISSKTKLITEEHLECFFNFFEGVFGSFGFKEINKTITEDSIELELYQRFDDDSIQRIQERIMRRRMKLPRKSSPSGRKILAVSKELIDELSSLIKNKEMTLFNYLNENVLKSALFLEKMQIPLTSIFKMFEAYKMFFELGIHFFPAPIWFNIAQFGAKTPAWEKMWRELGRKSYKFFKEKIPSYDLKSLEYLTRITFLQEVKIDAKVEIIEDHDKFWDVEFKIFGESMPESVMSGVAFCYEEIIKEFGYKLIDRQVSRGICILRLKKKMI